MNDQPKPAPGKASQAFKELADALGPEGIERLKENMESRPTTGEWTVYSVMKLRQKHWHEEDKNNAIAIAYNSGMAAVQLELDRANAALAEKQSAVDGALRVIKTSVTLLAAEKDAFQKLVDQNTSYREALAAEREKTKELRRLLDAAGCTIIDEI